MDFYLIRNQGGMYETRNKNCGSDRDVLYMLVAFLVPEMPMIARIVVGGFGAFIAGYMIKTIIERIMEIRKGEDDDLSNY